MHSSIADLATLGRLFDEYRPRLLGMLERRIDMALRARIDPQDILQQAYLTAHVKWPTISAKYRQEKLVEQSGFSIYAWLYREAWDELIEAYRKQSRAPRDMGRDMPWPEGSALQLGMSLMDNGTSPSGQMKREELCANVNSAMRLLKKEYREILWMRHFDQLSYQEISVVKEITENNAMVRHVRALKKFKALWEQLQPFERSA